MNWGQLRFQLQTGAPSVSADLLDEFLNSRYEQLLEATNWQGLDYHATIQTAAAYQSTTDTVNLTVGSQNVTGVGTTWTSAATNGMNFYRPGDTVIYTFTWVSGTAGTLDRPYEGVGTDPPGTLYTAAPYVFQQDIYQLPADVRSIVDLLDPITGYPLGRMTAEEMDNSCGQRTLVQDPTNWAPYDDTNEANPPVIHQVRLFPPPLYARGIKFEYLHTASGFDGGNTQASPLPWISQSSLLAGCRCSIETYLASQSEGAAAAAHANAARTYAAEWAVEINRLLLVEFTQKRKKVPMQMASRFTRHRVLRACRGFRNAWGPGAGGPN